MSTGEFVIEEELKKLPPKPGVYLMHGENDEIIYVGKAVKLNNRVKSYFRKSIKSAKTNSMISHISRFEYIITDSETEALILECNLIKEHHPKYNIMLMDDKTYPYIKVSVNEAFPKINLARRIGKDTKSSKYFGPYTSNYAVKETIDLLCKLYYIRTCNKKLPENIGKTRPCLNYDIGKCKAPCVGNISSKEYAENVHKAIEFLNGNHKEVLNMLKSQMKEASEKMDYEKAAEIRDIINSLNNISSNQKITDVKKEDRDIIGLAHKDHDCMIKMFFVRNGKMIGQDNFYIEVPLNQTDSEILEQFLIQYYSGTPYIPMDIMLPIEVENYKHIEEMIYRIHEIRTSLVIPIKGKKEKMVELASKNAKMLLDKDLNKIKLQNVKTIGALRNLEKLLGLKNVSRIEAYDISNISGVNSIGSMVVYEKALPQKSDYRKFNIKTVSGMDDYKSLKEVLTRRFERAMLELKQNNEKSSFGKLPDLILMDGGKGQVHIALEVLTEMGFDIPIAGMVKDDHHRTRGLYYKEQEIAINPRSEEFNLITRIQDEAHRFAITSHRNLRSKEQIKSVLDDIKGVGPAKRKVLRRELGDIENIRNASIDTLKEIPEISESLAKTIYEFFHGKGE